MIHFPVPEALTFDDVLLLPGRSDVVPANANNRIPLINNGTMDLECASTSNLNERKKVVAFSITHFVSNIRALVRKDSPYKKLSDLNGKSIAIIPGMTALPMLVKYAADNHVTFNQTPGKDVAEAEARKVARELLEQARIAPAHYRKAQRSWLDAAQRLV